MEYRVVSYGKYWGIDKWVTPLKVWKMTLLKGYWEPVRSFSDGNNRILFDSVEDAEQYIKSMQSIKTEDFAEP